jgi:formate dehydrogenase maturation protein FdhE
MIEYQILVRLKKTSIKKKGLIQYGKCQVCGEKYSQRCIEASHHAEGFVFIFCNDCYLQVNDVCTKFIYNKKIYEYESSYHINEKPIKKKKKSSFWFDFIPFVVGNRLMF